MSWVNSLREARSGQRFSGKTRQLRNALEAENVTTVGLAEVEFDPGTVKVERDRIRSAHRLKDGLELVELDLAIVVLIEDAESNLQTFRTSYQQKQPKWLESR